MNVYIDLLIRISNHLATFDDENSKKFVNEIFELLF